MQNKRKDRFGSYNCLPMHLSESLNTIGESTFIMLDIYETSNRFIIEAEIPGVSTEDFEIYMSGGNLIIKGIKEEKIASSGKLNFFCMERSFGPFKRIVEIPSPIITNQIQADYSHGLLTITLPKAEERRMKRRKIKVNTL